MKLQELAAEMTRLRAGADEPRRVLAGRVLFVELDELDLCVDRRPAKIELLVLPQQLLGGESGCCPQLLLRDVDTVAGELRCDRREPGFRVLWQCERLPNRRRHGLDLDHRERIRMPPRERNERVARSLEPAKLLNKLGELLLGLDSRHKSPERLHFISHHLPKSPQHGRLTLDLLAA